VPRRKKGCTVGGGGGDRLLESADLWGKRKKKKAKTPTGKIMPVHASTHNTKRAPLGEGTIKENLQKKGKRRVMIWGGIKVAHGAGP